MVEVSLTVGKLDASMALLLTKDHYQIEFPTILLPDGITTGSVVRICCERDLEQELKEKEEFNRLQEEIYELFGKYEPKNPNLKVVNITQTSCVLEWDSLDLGTSELKELIIYKNGSKLSTIKNPLQRKNIKFSGLPIDTMYKFQLKLVTSSGNYYSNLVELKTHKMTDLSGITICIGEIDYSKEKFTFDDIVELIHEVGAKPLTNQVKIDTTQFICTQAKGLEYQKAEKMNIPIIRPEWLKACQLEKRIVGVNKFYLNSETPIWKQKDYWVDFTNGDKKIQKQAVADVPETIEPTNELSEEPISGVDEPLQENGTVNEPIDQVETAEETAEEATEEATNGEEVEESVAEAVVGAVEAEEPVETEELADKTAEEPIEVEDSVVTPEEADITNTLDKQVDESDIIPNGAPQTEVDQNQIPSESFESTEIIEASANDVLDDETEDVTDSNIESVTNKEELAESVIESKPSDTVIADSAEQINDSESTQPPTEDTSAQKEEDMVDSGEVLEQNGINVAEEESESTAKDDDLATVSSNECIEDNDTPVDPSVPESKTTKVNANNSSNKKKKKKKGGKKK